MGEIAPGTTVVFTEDSLGLMEHPEDRKFTNWVVGAGEKGTYVRAAEIPQYHVVAVEVDGRTLYCPARTGQFTVEG